MPSIGEDLLKERAYSFLRNARRLLEEGDYDLAAFSLEQFCQLLLKYELIVRTGSYPKTHSLLRLMRDLSKASGGSLDEFIENELILITKLEDAYIGARYLPRRYEKKEVEELLSFAERLKEVIESV